MDELRIEEKIFRRRGRGNHGCSVAGGCEVIVWTLQETETVATTKETATVVVMEEMLIGNGVSRIRDSDDDGSC